MSTLTQASRQWAMRPADERYLSLTDMHAAQLALRQHSRERILPSRALTIEAVPETDHAGLAVVGPNGGQLALSNYCFGQLAQLAGAPAGYLRGLPAELAADNLNYGLHVARDARDIGVLYSKLPDAAPVLRAATGPAYGRIWNSDVTAALLKRFGDGRTGDFRVPGEFGKAVEITTDNTTLYASDRDMFVFLADEKHRIDFPGTRREGTENKGLARGFFVWNSEVGDCTLGVALFLFDYVCCNRIVWGARDYREIRIRHTSRAPQRFLEEAAPQLERYAQSATAPIVAQIEAAQARKVSDLETFLSGRKFSRAQIESVQRVHVAEEGRPIETLWDTVTGITAYARNLPFQDSRVALEREAGKILDMAA